MAATKIQEILGADSLQTPHIIYCCFINYNVRWVSRRRRQSVRLLRLLQMLDRHLLNAATRHLYMTATISLFFPRRPYAAGSSETRQQCSRFGRIAGNLLVVFIMRYIYTRSFVPLPAVQFFFFISSADPIRRAKQQRRRAFSSE